MYCIRELTVTIKNIMSSRCIAAGGSIVGASVPRARPVNALAHSIGGLNIAMEDVTGSWYFTAGGSIASDTNPRAGHTNALVHCIRGLTIASKVSPVAVASRQVAISRRHSPQSKTHQCP